MYIYTYFYKEKIEKTKETREKHDNFNISSRKVFVGAINKT